MREDLSNPAEMMPDSSRSKRRARSWTKYWVSRMLYVTVAWLGVCALILVMVVKRRDNPYPEDVPAVQWASFEQLRLKTRDQLEIGAWYIPGRLDKPVVILMHGHGGNRGAVLDRAETVSKLGSPVLMVTARAHGDSEGNFNDIGWSARLDLEAACDWAMEKLPDQPVVLMGVSMGAVASIYAASEFSYPWAGLILECPYRHLVDSAMWRRGELYIPWGVSHAAFAGVKILAPVILGKAATNSPLDAIDRVPANIPILFIAGSRDRRAPVEDSEALARKAGSRASVVIVEGADHETIFNTNPTQYEQALRVFFANVETHQEEINHKSETASLVP
ncbi:lysophospholipase [bacterium]|nr:lysophospholipase [bacterium]